MTASSITEKTLVGDLVRRHPETAEVLFGIGFSCLGCPASQNESLEDACAVHGFSAEEVVRRINEVIALSEKEN